MSLVIGIELPDDRLARTAATGFDGLPKLLDDAGISYAVLGADRAGNGSGASLNPTIASTVFGWHTRGLGIVAAAAPQRDHPYNIARRIASLDHLTAGRAGWLALREDRAVALGHEGRSSWTPAPTDSASLTDAITAARTLWRSWPIESLRTSEGEHRPPGSTCVRYADHTGVFATTGPLNVPTTPQGEPLVWWRHESGDDPAHIGAADVVTVALGELAAAIEFPGIVRVHVRLDGADPALGSRIADLAGHPGVHGVLIRWDDALRGFLGRPLSGLVESGTVRTRSDRREPAFRNLSPTTGSGGRPVLRRHLGIARRTAPDLSRNRPVFAGS